jgi:hypothetical protein
MKMAVGRKSYVERYRTLLLAHKVVKMRPVQTNVKQTKTA